MIASQLPAIVSADGEVIRLEMIPMTADDAGAMLPKVTDWIKEARRLEGYLLDVVSSEMRQQGQTERRAGGIVFELKAPSTWVVDDPEAMGAAVLEAHRLGQVTREELEKGAQQRISWTFNHSILNSLAKRVPAIETFRRKESGEPRLSVKR